MQTARRLYVYLLTGIGLGVLVSGLSLLLATLFDRVLPGTGAVLAGDQATRERLTLATAMTAVSLPVWLIHWLVAERSVRPQRTDGAGERSSAERGLFFALALGALMLATYLAADSLVQTVILAITGESLEFRTPASDLGLLLVAGAAWLYHVRVRIRDWALGPMWGAGAHLPRFYLYLAAFLGLIALLSGLATLTALVARLLLDPPVDSVAGPGAWWAPELSSGVSRAILGAALWLGHWWYAGRLVADHGWRGASERPARLRLAYFFAVLVVVSAGVLGYLSQAAFRLLRGALGVDEGLVGAGMDEVLSGGVNAVLFGVAWWIHAAWLRDESAARPEGPASVTRLASYPPALVGLAFAAVGSAGLATLLIRLLAGGGQTLAGGDLWQSELATFLPPTILGTALWLWTWSAVERRRAAAPAEEAASALRRAALLLVLAVTLMAALIALGVILYRLFGTLFGVEVTGNVAAELSGPVAVVLVAVAVAAFHGLALRRDQALRQPDAAVAPLDSVSASAPISLRLTPPAGTSGSDVEATVLRLREQLPQGYTLEASE